MVDTAGRTRLPLLGILAVALLSPGTLPATAVADVITTELAATPEGPDVRLEMLVSGGASGYRRCPDSSHIRRTSSGGDQDFDVAWPNAPNCVETGSGWRPDAATGGQCTCGDYLDRCPGQGTVVYRTAGSAPYGPDQVVRVEVSESCPADPPPDVGTGSADARDTSNDDAGRGDAAGEGTNGGCECSASSTTSTGVALLVALTSLGLISMRRAPRP